jgi:hypothetical protein
MVFVGLIAFFGGLNHTAEAVPENSPHFLSVDHGYLLLEDLEGTGDSRIELTEGRLNRVVWGGQVSSLRVEYSLIRTVSAIEKYETRSKSNKGDLGEFSRTGVHLDFYGYEDWPDYVPFLTNYWGLGLGLDRYEMDIRVPGEVTIDETDSGLNLGLFVGIEWMPAPRHRFSFQYRYTFHPEIGFDDTGDDRTLDLESFREPSLFIGYRWFY